MGQHRLREITILSGKGGAGKTSLSASLLPWLDSPVLADCDVDAPDFDILLSPELEESRDFQGAQKARIDPEHCSQCGVCMQHCRFDAIDHIQGVHYVDPHSCEGCGVCAFVCPHNAVDLKPAVVGTVNRSKTPYGTLIHGKLIPGEEASGKLVSEVRKSARELAVAQNAGLIIVDGPPGIGCPAISSITGTDHVVLVTEPSPSGFHDLKRLAEVVSRFALPMTLVINKWDLDAPLAEQIQRFAEEQNIPVSMKIPFHRGIVDSILQRHIPSLGMKEEYEEWGMEQLIHALKEG
ncbi:ATP-binding protein [Salinispira pacifica]|uniref:MinD superfamily P-loop ATPase n=1 Tax=Salinispira pacifica TaxID=1307761 RepID=V5WKE1_9SPIO|nr:ATP-binding protein [Salinispira pacifica]AHC15661.1 MinD superfamily P-loop ATPase [Salinispira pacifica]